MSVSTLVTLVDLVKTKWQSNVVQNRSGEQAQLQAHLGTDATYAAVTRQMEEWSRNLKTLAAKPRVSSSIAKSLVQATAQCFSNLGHALDHAGHGVDWICNNKNFAVSYSLAVLLVRELTLETARESTALVDAAKVRLEKDLAYLQVGSAQAKCLIDQESNINEQIETIEQASEAVKEKMNGLTSKIEEVDKKIDELLSGTEELATEKRSKVSEEMSEFSSALEDAKNTVSDAIRLKEEAQTLVNVATKAQGEAEAKNTKALETLEEATQKQVATNGRLTEALRNAQMEGLAGSFTKKASEAEDAISEEQKKFERALLYLAVVACLGLVVELTTGMPKNAEEFSFRLIRTLSFAAPGIWVAWAAARRLGALNRVFSDYQYKSASALAYESYRQTVADAGDDELKKQLLAFAIKSFGENPTRYYDSAQNDPSSPAESWLSKVLPSSKSSGDKTKQLID